MGNEEQEHYRKLGNYTGDIQDYPVDIDNDPIDFVEHVQDLQEADLAAKIRGLYSNNQGNHRPDMSFHPGRSVDRESMSGMFEATGRIPEDVSEGIEREPKED